MHILKKMKTIYNTHLCIRNLLTMFIAMKIFHLFWLCLSDMTNNCYCQYLVYSKPLDSAGEGGVSAEGNRRVFDAAAEPHLARPSPWNTEISTEWAKRELYIESNPELRMQKKNCKHCIGGAANNKGKTKASGVWSCIIN